MAQFLLTEILGLSTLDSIISDISPSILKILEPILLQISWIFQNIPNFLHLDGFEETYGQKTKNIGNQNNDNLSKSWNLTFFEYKISELLFHSCCLRIPTWKFAHLEWSKQVKYNRKTPRYSWYLDPSFRTRQTGHPVVHHIYNILICLDVSQVAELQEEACKAAWSVYMERCAPARVPFPPPHHRPFPPRHQQGQHPVLAQPQGALKVLTIYCKIGK